MWILSDSTLKGIVVKMRRIFLVCLSLVMLFSAMPSFAKGENTGKTYYISNDGNDENNGLSENAPFKSFHKLTELEFYAGDKILLKCGDVWFEELILRDIKGERNNPIVISSYGEGEKPVIDGRGKKENVGLYINDPSNITVSDLYIRNCGIGVCMEYFNSGAAENLVFRNLDFVNVQGRNKFTPVDADKNALGYNSRSCGIQIYGELMGDSKLNNVLVDNCHANYGDMLIYADINESQGKGIQPIENMLIKNSSAQNFTTFGIQINGVKHGVIENCVIKNGRAMNYPHGLTAILIGATKHFYIRNCEIAYMGRYRDNPDGSGIDFERNNVDSHVENCYIHHCEGYGITFYYNNENCSVTNSTFFMNNASSVFKRDIHIFDKADDNIQHDIVIANNKYKVPPSVTEFADQNSASNVFSNEELTARDGDLFISDDFELEGVSDVPRAWEIEHKSGFVRVSDIKDINDKAVRIVENAKSGQVEMKKNIPLLEGEITASQMVLHKSGSGYLPRLCDENGNMIAGAFTQNGEMYLKTDKEEKKSDFNITGQWHQIRVSINTDKCEALLYIDDALVQSAKIGEGQKVRIYSNTVFSDTEAEVFADKIKLAYGKLGVEEKLYEKAFSFDANSPDYENTSYILTKENPVIKKGIKISKSNSYEVEFEPIKGELIVKQRIAEVQSGSILLSNKNNIVKAGIKFSDGKILTNNDNKKLCDIPEGAFYTELIINLNTQKMTVIVNDERVGEKIPLKGRLDSIDNICYNGDFVLDEMSVRKLKFYKREFYEDIEVGEAPKDWILKNDVNARGTVYKKHEDGRDYMMFSNTRTVPASSASQYRYISQPLSGLVQFSMKICPENIRYGRNVYLYAPNSKAVFSWNFSEGRNMITIDGAWEQVGEYKAGQWYDLSIIANTDTQKCTVYLDGELYADNIPFRNPTESIGIFQIHWGNYEGGVMDFENVEIMNYETVAQSRFEEHQEAVETVVSYTNAVNAAEDMGKMMFNSQTGIVMVQQYVQGEGDISVLGNCGLPMLVLNMKDSILSYENNAMFVPLGTVDTSIKNDLRIVIDTKKRHYSVFVNGEILAAKLPITSDIQTVSGIGFSGDTAIFSAKVISYVQGVPIRVYDDFESNQNNIWVE